MVGDPFRGFFLAAEIECGTPGDPGRDSVIGWNDLQDLPQPLTIAGEHLLPGLVDGSIPM